MCQLAVESVLAVSGDADVRVYISGEVPRTEAFRAVLANKRVNVHVIDPDEVFESLPSHLQGVAVVYSELGESRLSARSNILRYCLLYLYGGIYLDFDVVLLDDLRHLVGDRCAFGVERVWRGDNDRVSGNWAVPLRPSTWVWALSWCAKRIDSSLFHGHFGAAEYTSRFERLWAEFQPNNAIMASKPEDAFVGELINGSMAAKPGIRYSTGPTLVGRITRQHPDLVRLLDPETFYFIPPGDSFRFFEDSTVSLPSEALAIHYVSSNHSQLLESICESNRHQLKPSLISSLIDWVVDSSSSPGVVA
jgi:hypothetical protein